MNGFVFAGKVVAGEIERQIIKRQFFQNHLTLTP